MSGLDKDGFILLGERYEQRMSSSAWKKVLLAGEDTVIYAGRVRHLVGKSLGFGAVSVKMEPLKESNQ